MKVKPSDKCSPILVEWTDSTHYHGWRTPDEIDEFVREGNDTIKSVGYLYAEDRNHVVIVQSISDVTGNYDATMRIPKVAITKRMYLDARRSRSQARRKPQRRKRSCRTKKR